VADVRKFLLTCKGVSDKELFGKEEYWQPPEDFEKLRKGDCEDFSLWTWRQFLDMGYNARLVLGRHGRYRTGHAWVSFQQNGKCYLVEPQLSVVGEKFPRLSTLRYHPEFSVCWSDEKLTFYSHNKIRRLPSFAVLISLVPEWLRIWGGLVLRVAYRIPLVTFRRLLRVSPNRTAFAEIPKRLFLHSLIYKE
jgi:Bacterial transglutaminase-like cysteine proteinase BTLCP